MAARSLHQILSVKTAQKSTECVSKSELAFTLRLSLPVCAKELVGCIEGCQFGWVALK